MYLNVWDVSNFYDVKKILNEWGDGGIIVIYYKVYEKCF